METKELLSKLDQIQEHARLSIEEFPHLTKERSRMIIALVVQLKAAHDPDATVTHPESLETQ